MAEKKQAEHLPTELLENAEVIFSGPAPFANRVYVTASPMGFRLTFMEGYPGGEERFRTAVYVSVLDALSLKEVLDRQLQNVGLTVEVAEAAEKTS